MTDIESFIRGLPKTDLHMHIEGSIEPQLMLNLAARNGMKLRWDTAEALRAAYHFTNLKSFLDLYFEGCKVLVSEADFHDVTRAYLRRAHEDGVIRAELFIGPQSFIERGTAIEALMSGVLGAMEEARCVHGISVGLMISVHRHRTEADAMVVLDQIMPWKDQIIAIAMGGAEVGNPPAKFARFFAAARDRGFRTTVHAGEEGPAAYVREALELLQVDRIDHGNACLADPGLVRELAMRHIPLTVCPLSNLRLQVVTDMARHTLKTMMAQGLHVTVNSDDPAYFGGYVTENLLACRDALGLSVDDIVLLVRNGLEAAFVTKQERQILLGQLDTYLARHAAASTSQV
ncbi:MULTISPECIES: adenosine deaminase [Rhodopseudomonas]|uniref:Adenine deaminase n=1 Tax=Rhodopseudomonas palustris TaxID=1076 RepID=A0A0D7EJJ6_RHOPL|nr:MULTISPECIES: adenosine deaminase [Rhodopseudomonas]KIZ40806.1 adenine deaminase [Rhodopseudomonas palustris]MDF3812912.1 adenosine deaminase [Rhodopseudomonas sp. BAL398]WOK18509.1 adenosine deaminase [Rhodopseudomonas sp. BAL398]